MAGSSHKKVYLLLMISMVLSSCSSPQQAVAPTVVKVDVRRMDPVDEIDDASRYIAEIELSQQIRTKYSNLKSFCTARRIFIYTQNYEPGEVASFPTMMISVFGKDFFIESYVQDEEALGYYGRKIAELGKLESWKPIVIDFGSSSVVRVRVKNRVTMPQIVYLFRHDSRGFKYTRIQYICRNLPGRQVRKLFSEWVRYQKEFVVE